MTYTSLEYLTPAELHQIYLNDYTGASGIIRSSYFGREGAKYRYMICIVDPQSECGQYLITNIWIIVDPVSKEAHIHYAGAPLFETNDRSAMNRAWDDHMKNAHIVNGSLIQNALKTLIMYPQF